MQHKRNCENNYLKFYKLKTQKDKSVMQFDH